MTETQIRDVNDRPILRAAIEAKADVLLTGDKDFLESGVKNPMIMTPAEFLNIWRIPGRRQRKFFEHHKKRKPMDIFFVHSAVQSYHKELNSVRIVVIK